MQSTLWSMPTLRCNRCQCSRTRSPLTKRATNLIEESSTTERPICLRRPKEALLDSGQTPMVQPQASTRVTATAGTVPTADATEMIAGPAGVTVVLQTGRHLTSAMIQSEGRRATVLPLAELT